MRDIFKSFILSLDKKATISKSNSTDSIYYNLLNMKIRYSDHMGACDAKYDISIIKSANVNSYVLQIKQSRCVLILPLNEIKSYIKSQFLFKTLVIKQISSLKNTIDFNKTEMLNTDDWGSFANLLAKRYKSYKKYTDLLKKVMRKHFMECNIRGEKFVEIYQKLSPSMSKEQIESIFEANK